MIFLSDNILMNKKLFVLMSLILFLGASVFSSVYKSEVTASYYAEKFHGKKTSNGEIFNMYSYTCAHKSLPFNTVLKVTNLSNGKTVNVRVNDRGPFVQNREIDLSKAAAVKLDMIKTGTAKVKLEIVSLGKNTKASAQTARKANAMMGVSSSSEKKTKKTVFASSKNNLWDVQLGAFESKANAKILAQKLLKAGFEDVVFQTGGGVVRVAIRRVSDEKLPSVEKKLNENGYFEYTVKKRTQN